MRAGASELTTTLLQRHAQRLLVVVFGAVVVVAAAAAAAVALPFLPLPRRRPRLADVGRVGCNQLARVVQDALAVLRGGGVAEVVLAELTQADLRRGELLVAHAPCTCTAKKRHVAAVVVLGVGLACGHGYCGTK